MLPSSCRVVIVGGGIVGCSLLYHLAKEGWSDCLLIEKSELTSGSTWHAAGAITHSIANAGLARIADYGIGLYQRLEAETGQSVSWHPSGSLRLAYTDDQVDFLHSIVSTGRTLGHPMELVGPARLKELHPFYRTEGVKAALHTPADGHVDPAGATFAFAKGARAAGARIVRHNRVTGIARLPGGEWRVTTEQGPVRCEIVVNAGGTYARQIGQWVGLDLPVLNAAHQYLITEPIAALASLPHELPLLRDGHKISAYFRQEQQSILMGFYEKADPHLVWLDGTPWDAVNELFPADLDAIMPTLEIALERMPILADAGIRKTINGAIMDTPDGVPLLGPAPGLRNFWCACGVTAGVAAGPGIGRYLAQWMVHGRADINMRQFDPRRFGRWCDGPYAVAKVKEDYVLRHDVPFPGRDRPAARPVRSSALYGRLGAQGAVFEQMAGWERPLWFARGDVPRRHIESYRRTAVQGMVAAEAKAVRERAGLLDISGFAKVELSGPDAASFLDRLSTNRIPQRVGGLALTYFLNEAGTFEAELVCTRLGSDRFYLVYAALDELRVLDWLAFHRRPDERVAIENKSDAFGCIALAGPMSRQVLQAVTTQDLTNAGFPRLTSRTIEVAGKTVLALRLSLTGELGWELHGRMEHMPAVFDALWQAGVPHGIAHFGTAALNAMRLEKAFKGTRELNATVNPFEAGVMRLVRLDKGLFVGRDALVAQADGKPLAVCVYLRIDGADADCQGNEPLLHERRVVGSVSSGAFGPYVQQSLAFGFVERRFAEPGTRMTVGLLGDRRDATVLPAAAYDPRVERPGL
jgi:dimethylglycine dehydrogenase